MTLLTEFYSLFRYALGLYILALTFLLPSFFLLHVLRLYYPLRSFYCLAYLFFFAKAFFGNPKARKTRVSSMCLFFIICLIL